MKINIKVCSLILALSFSVCGLSQTIQPKDVIISSFLPDNILGRYNIGIEYFFLNKKNKQLNPFSIILNGAKTSSIIQNEKISGIDITSELNFYGKVLMAEKWNEYGGLKVSYGNFKNETINEKKSSYFIGVSTGVQPIILKRLALKINSDIGYMKNGLSTMSFFGSKNDVFYSGFTINFNVGLGVRF